MEDWNSDLLLSVIQFLNYRDAGHLAVQSRRFCYWVHQYRRWRGPELVAATSSMVGVRSRQRTADEVCRDALSQLQAPPVLALAFGTPHVTHPSNPFQTSLPQRVPSTAIVLGSIADSVQTAGKGGCEHRSHHALMMLAGLSANTVVRPFLVHSRLVPDDPSLFHFRDSFEPDLAWKMIIVYVCGDGVRIADSAIQMLQEKFPAVTIVGGICSSAYVSLPIDPEAVTMDKLRNYPSHALRRMYQAMGGPDLPNALTKAQLVKLVHAVAQVKPHQLETISDATTGQAGGICGVALAGEVPVRAIVSRGVRSLTVSRSGGDGTPQPETSFYVAHAETVWPGEAGYILAGEDPPPYHLLRTIKDEASGKMYSVQEMIRTFGRPDFLGLRTPQQDGFLLMSPHPISANLNGFLLIPESEIAEHTTLVGSNVDLFELSGRECMKDMDFCMAKLREQTVGEEVLGAIMFSCSGRGPRAGSLITEEMADAKRFAKAFPNVPCLGFYAGGEIGPLALAGRQSVFQQGNAGVQGFTAVFALFIVPRFAALEHTMGIDDSKDSVDAFWESRLHRDRSLQ